MLGNEVNMSQALVVTLFSMGIVFATLLALSFILDGFKVAFYKDKKKSTKPQAQPEKIVKKEVEQVITEQDDNELIAVISAALAYELSTSVDNIVVRNIKRVPQTTPIWGRISRIEN